MRKPAPAVGGRLPGTRRSRAFRAAAPASTLRAVLPGVANVLTGGAGDDELETRDGGAAIDKLVCGAGVDTYDRDPADSISLCEANALP